MGLGEFKQGVMYLGILFTLTIFIYKYPWINCNRD